MNIRVSCMHVFMNIICFSVQCGFMDARLTIKSSCAMHIKVVVASLHLDTPRQKQQQQQLQTLALRAGSRCASMPSNLSQPAAVRYLYLDHATVVWADKKRQKVSSMAPATIYTKGTLHKKYCYDRLHVYLHLCNMMLVYTTKRKPLYDNSY